MIRWWNAGRYERECAEFDAAHPLSRQVWTSLVTLERRWVASLAMRMIMPEDDGGTFAVRYHYHYNPLNHSGYNGVFHIDL